jgi:hypothetical protein
MITKMRTGVFLFLFGSFFLAAGGLFGAMTLGSDMLFTTSLDYLNTNALETNQMQGWTGKSSYMFLGLYPEVNDKLLSGDAKLFVGTYTNNYFYFGGARMSGSTPDKTFTANIYAMAPMLGLSDPMQAGAAYGYSVVSLPVVSMTRFTSPDVGALYPVTVDPAKTGGYTNDLGGNNSLGVMTKMNLFDDAFAVEDFYNWNMMNFDSYGVIGKLKQFEVAEDILTLDAGVGADMLKYKQTQNFQAENSWLFYDQMRRLPSQSTNNEDAFVSYGGFLNADLLDTANIFGEFKLNQETASYNNQNLTNALNGWSLYSGAYSSALDGTTIEADLAMNHQQTNTNCGFNGQRNGLEVKGKIYSDLEIDEDSGLDLSLLLEGTYSKYQDSVTPFGSYEGITLTNNGAFTNMSGYELKGSFKLTFLDDFSVQGLCRYAVADFSSPGTYHVEQLDTRAYLNIDLGSFLNDYFDVNGLKGLSVTGGVRYVHYVLNPSATNAISGVAAYLEPYGEILFNLGTEKASFFRLTYGMGEDYSVLANAFGVGYDNWRRLNSSFGVTQNNLFYNNADYQLANDVTITFEVGIKI